jgi:hypothetical protein
VVSGDSDVEIWPQDSNGKDTVLQIPAGTVRYFEIRANISDVSSASSLTIYLKGDNINLDEMLTARQVWDKQAKFVWSPNSNGVSSVSDADWTNGYRVSWLPSSGLMGQVLIGVETIKPITVLSPNGGEVWTESPDVTDTISGHEKYKQSIKWTGAPDDFISIFNGTVKAYLEKYENGQYVTIGRIPPFAYGSIDWVVGVVSKSSCSLLSGAGANGCFEKSNMFLVAPGQYYVRVVNTQTEKWDRSDSSFSIVSSLTACTDSDGGKDYYVKGTTVGMAGDNVISTDTDSCSGDTLVEWICLDKFNGLKNIYRTNTNYQCPNGCSNGACLKEPVIDIISGPTSLKTGGFGTWKITAHDPDSTSLDFVIEWGEGNPSFGTPLQASQKGGQISQDFSHIYSSSGTYTITATAKDKDGLSVKKSVTVVVGELLGKFGDRYAGETFDSGVAITKPSWWTVYKHFNSALEACQYLYPGSDEVVQTSETAAGFTNSWHPYNSTEALGSGPIYLNYCYKTNSGVSASTDTGLENMKNQLASVSDAIASLIKEIKKFVGR